MKQREGQVLDMPVELAKVRLSIRTKRRKVLREWGSRVSACLSVTFETLMMLSFLFFSYVYMIENKRLQNGLQIRFSNISVRPQHFYVHACSCQSAVIMMSLLLSPHMQRELLPEILYARDKRGL